MSRIAVDIDEVLMPFFQSLADWHNAEYGTSYSADELTEFKLSASWGGPENYWIDTCNMFHSMGGSAAVDINPEAQSSLMKLSKDNEIVLITSRPSMHRKHTEGWMEKHLSGITDTLIMCDDYAPDGGSFHMHKGEIARDAGADVLIDDAVHYIERTKEAGVRGILFGDYGWNRHGHDKHEHARDWKEVMLLLGDGNV